jgi:RNA polymerase sigma-70 factor (ECF subfamily)
MVLGAMGRYPAVNEEIDIIEKAKRGDTKAFEALFEKHRNFVWSVAFRMTYRHDAAEDLAQEVFLTVWRKLPTFEGKSAFSTWLYRITVNTTLNWQREVMRFAKLPNDGKWETDNSGGSNGPEKAALAREAERTLARLLRGLEKDRRLVFIMRELEGLSYAEIAEATGWPLGTVRSRLARARGELSRMAEELGEKA